MIGSPYQELALSIAIAGLALLLDMAFGEPPIRIHPTVWMGRTIAFLETKARRGIPAFEKSEGVLLGLGTLAVFVVPVYLGLLTLRSLGFVIAYTIAGALLLKSAIAVKSMAQFTNPIRSAVERGDYTEAKDLLRHVVRRDTSELTEQQVISATVETIAEGTVDGITSGLFYFGLLGVPGAVAFRVINTLDSMLGYRDSEHLHVGWFSAKADTIANYLPARLTALLTIIAARFAGKDSKNSISVLLRDHNKTESTNAGWPMAAMAGALDKMVEKPGSYSLGDSNHCLVPEDIGRALRIMKLNTILFLLFVTTPLLCLSSFMGWPFG